MGLAGGRSIHAVPTAAEHRALGHVYRAGGRQRIDDYIAGTAATFRKAKRLPTEATVGAASDANPGGGDIHVLGVVGIDCDAGNSASIERTGRGCQVRPVGAAISGFQNAIAVIAVAGIVRLPESHINDLRISRLDGNGADGQARLIVGDGDPAQAAVDCLPHASTGGADIHRVARSVCGRDCRDSARRRGLANAKPYESGVNGRWPDRVPGALD
jgi:hypothetical protein